MVLTSAIKSLQKTSIRRFIRCISGTVKNLRQQLLTQNSRLEVVRVRVCVCVCVCVRVCVFYREWEYFFVFKNNNEISLVHLSFRPCSSTSFSFINSTKHYKMKDTFIKDHLNIFQYRYCSLFFSRNMLLMRHKTKCFARKYVSIFIRWYCIRYAKT